MIKTEYIWKELSSDGLLKEPKDIGPYYNTDNVNPYSGGYESREEAIEALISYCERNELTYDEFYLAEKVVYEKND